ncbi:hypothetical protein [Paenibacillus terrae]|uniref:hypothetical protein n=1 Tax=Paenibacillus terrae TaxID=159743 RepID=UPI0011EABAA6|nr:hypothetical protein [Paenibacillus terrae]
MRDLNADLTLCEAATSGNWLVADGSYVLDGESWETGGAFVAECEREVDAEFIAKAREGWPEAIKRAIKAEALIRKIGTLSATSDITEEQSDYYNFFNSVDEAAALAKIMIEKDGHSLCEYCGKEYVTNTSNRENTCSLCSIELQLDEEEEEWRSLLEHDDGIDDPCDDYAIDDFDDGSDDPEDSAYWS